MVLQRRHAWGRGRSGHESGRVWWDVPAPLASTLHQPAVETLRQLKPDIPLVGSGGRPIRHELEQRF